MTAFDLAELRRLSDAATKGPMVERQDHGGPYIMHDYGKCLATVHTTTDDALLLAYLGTHREAILALLEAADALAEALRVGPMCDLCVRLYRASGRGPPMSRCAHSIKASESRMKEALAAYNKAKGA